MFYCLQAFFFDWSIICTLRFDSTTDWVLWMDFLLEHPDTSLRIGSYNDDLSFHLVARNASYLG